MTKTENERLRTLEKRRNWLQTRIYNNADSKADLSFDRAELSALEWAIGLVEQYLGVKDKECNHYWALLTSILGGAVFCQRCLETRRLAPKQGKE